MMTTPTPFERFLMMRTRYSTRISIRKNGEIYIPHGVLKMTPVKDKSWWVLLNYHREQKVIGLVLTQDANEIGAVKLNMFARLSPKKRIEIYAKIYAREFFKHFEIPIADGRKIEAQWDAERMLLTVKV